VQVIYFSGKRVFVFVVPVGRTPSALVARLAKWPKLNPTVPRVKDVLLSRVGRRAAPTLCSGVRTPVLRHFPEWIISFFVIEQYQSLSNAFRLLKVL
jgi:hypothetical protein